MRSLSMTPAPAVAGPEPAACSSGLRVCTFSIPRLRGLQPRMRSPYDLVSPRAAFTSAVRCPHQAWLALVSPLARPVPGHYDASPEITAADRIRANRAKVRASSRIVFAPALSDQAHVTSVCHDHLMTQFLQQPTHPRRMRARLQGHPAARHGDETFSHPLRRRCSKLRARAL